MRIVSSFFNFLIGVDRAEEKAKMLLELYNAAPENRFTVSPAGSFFFQGPPAGQFSF
jgi:hypothetical protein